MARRGESPLPRGEGISTGVGRGFGSQTVGLGSSPPILPPMNKSLGLQLIVYGLLLAGLSFLTHHLCPGLSRPVLIVGLVGGPLCCAWGLRGILGNTGKALPVLTLIPVSFVMLSQAVITWTGRQELAGRQAAATVIALLFVLSMAMLMRVAYAGVTFGSAPAKPCRAA